MDEIAPEYDVVVLGTGKLPQPRNWRGRPQLTFHPDRSDRMCPLWVCHAPYRARKIPAARLSWANYRSSVLSVKGKKVLHIDRNDHYGGYAPEVSVCGDEIG